MFFNADEDDHDFMSAGKGSKLANLFGMDKASGQGGNSSLTYQAPKEPKKKETPTATPQGNSPVVAVACVVQAYKFVDNKYSSQGKLGAAILVNHSTKDYRILLYVSKQQQVTNAKISSAFTFNIQENNYASFYDDGRQTWSILFDSAENAHKFAKEIAIARANSASDALIEVVKQDVAPGEGNPLEYGDLVEVKYSGWLLTNFALNPTPFDSNMASDKLFRFKVGKGKVIKGWDQGMLGLKKGGKRMLIIPPALGYGSQGVPDRIPANSTLAFEVELVRVKHPKGEAAQESSEASTPSTTPAATPTPVATAEVPSLPAEQQDDDDDPGVRSRTRSINEQLNQPQNTNKAKLISRMARMGKPMLPFQGGAVPAQAEEDEADMQYMEEQYQPVSPKPPLASKPRAGSYSTHPHAMTSHPEVATQGQPLQNQFQPYQQQQQAFQPIQQPQPAFLQNLPGAQQMAVYQNPQNILQQQQQQQLQQQQLQQQQLQQQLLQQQQAQIHPGMAQHLPTQAPMYTVGGAPSLPTMPPVNPTPPTSSTDSLAPVLLTETRQQNTEVRLSISKMADKVDKILDKVEHMGSGMPGMGVMSPYGNNMAAPYGSNMAAPTMEANVLMQNITRIVQDNERLKKEVYDQSSKVQEQNEKINNLLEKNQKYVEQSQNLLEQRNEGYKNTANQSQARVLSLEQEKVSLATELSTASAQITILQLELGDIRKREGELKQQLQATSSTGINTKDELDRLRLMKEENEEKIGALTTAVREEKQARKHLESKMSQHQEELQDLKSSNETLEKNLTEKKKKASEERRKLEEDLEDSKINYETTIESLREKLRRQKTSTDTETESKISKIEEEISKDWQQKSERMLATATEKHKRQLTDVKDEKEELSGKVAELEKKLTLVRSSGSSTEQQVSELRQELEEMTLWKGKYENLRNQASAMKEKYEKRIEELEEEKEEEVENIRELKLTTGQQKQELLQQIQQLRSSASSTRLVQSDSSPPADVAAEVKKIMNKVFQTLRAKFEADDKYPGSQVLATILGVIKQITLELVSTNSSAKEAADEEEDEETEEEEDEEEEEEEEVEEKEEEEEDELGDSDEEKAPEAAVEMKDEETSHVRDSEELTPSKVSTITTAPSSTKASSSSDVQKPTLPSEMPLAPRPLPDDATVQHREETESHSANQEDESRNSPVGNNVAKDEERENEMSETESSNDFSQKGEDAVSVDGKIEEPLAPPVVGNNSNEHNISTPEPEKVPEKVPETIHVSSNGLVDAVSKDGEEDVSKTEDEAEIFSQSAKGENDVKEEGASESSKENSTKLGEEEDRPSPPADTSSREPPPLFDDDEDDNSLFGNDSNVSDTFGPAFDTKVRSQSEISNSDVPSVTPKDKTTLPPAKKIDLGLDEDNKPQPPPPLFGDDSDDDDLDWLS